MIIEDITDFLPKYPNINNYKEEILNPYDENFNLSIFRKKEFYDNKLDAYEDLPPKGELLKHQKTVSTFFSSTARASKVSFWSITFFEHIL